MRLRVKTAMTGVGDWVRAGEERVGTVYYKSIPNPGQKETLPPHLHGRFFALLRMTCFGFVPK